MIQVIFFAVLIVSLLAGYFAYLSPSQPINLMKILWDKSGYSSTEALNRKGSQQINTTTNQGVMKARQQADDLVIGQNKFLDTLRDKRLEEQSIIQQRMADQKQRQQDRQQ